MVQLLTLVTNPKKEKIFPIKSALLSGLKSLCDINSAIKLALAKLCHQYKLAWTIEFLSLEYKTTLVFGEGRFLIDHLADLLQDLSSHLQLS